MPNTIKTTNYRKFKTFREVHRMWLKDKIYKKAYKDLDLEFSLIAALIDARLRKGLTQKQLAEKAGTRQSSIARFESGTYNPTLAFVQKLANALNTKIQLA